MARRVFFSFHFANDFWRTQQVRNMNSLEGQALCSPNDWEEVKRKGDASIKKWIDDQLQGKTCVVVLVGAETANRPWVIHEISKGWNDKRGVLGIRIDRLLDTNSRPSGGSEPIFEGHFYRHDANSCRGRAAQGPDGADSKAVYASIANNIEAWIEEAIRIRANN